MRLNHVNIRTRNLERMRTFFEQVAGLAVGDRPAFDFAGYWLYDDSAPVIHLVATDRHIDLHGAVDHVSFIEQGLGATRKRLSKMGYLYEEMPVPGSGVTLLFVPGPEGATIELQFLPVA